MRWSASTRKPFTPSSRCETPTPNPSSSSCTPAATPVSRPCAWHLVALQVADDGAWSLWSAIRDVQVDNMMDTAAKVLLVRTPQNDEAEHPYFASVQSLASPFMVTAGHV